MRLLRPLMARAAPPAAARPLVGAAWRRSVGPAAGAHLGGARPLSSTNSELKKVAFQMALKRFSREKVTPAATLVISRAPVKKAIFSERLQI